MHFVLQDGYAVRPLGFPEYPVSFRFGDQLPTLQETSAPGVQDVVINDSGRAWTGSTSISIVFTEAVTADATGWSATVNGVSKAVAYVSGSGTQTVIYSIATDLKHGDVIRLSYSQAAGNTISVSGSVEIKALTGVQIGDELTKRIRFTLCDANDALVNETVKVSAHEYDSGAVANNSWMLRTDKASVATGATGQVDMEYTGTAAVGANVYCVVFRVTESLAVQTTVT